ncbi:MAG: hypothetical protein AAFU79_02995 [Myxococcota bacterium]
MIAVALAYLATNCRPPTANTPPAHPAAGPGPVQSVDVLEWGEGYTLFIGDNRSMSIHAVDLERPSSSGPDLAFNVLDLEAAVERTSGIDRFDVLDLSVHPVSGEAVLAVELLPKREPRLLLITAGGEIDAIDPNELEVETLPLTEPPPERLTFLDGTRAQALTVTDIEYFRGELLISGLSHGKFSSVVRRTRYPFEAAPILAHVSMFHTVHNQVETRSPIISLEVELLSGTPYVIAVYMCTPLVVAPLAAFADGARVEGKTIAELGWGNTPIDFLGMDIGVPWMNGRFFVLTSQQRSALLVGLDDIERHAGLPDLREPTPFPLEDHAGVPVRGIAMGDVSHIADQNMALMLTLSRSKTRGTLKLTSRIKGLFLRISEFVDEYSFPSYDYDLAANSEWQKKNIRAARTWLLETEGRVEAVK